MSPLMWTDSESLMNEGIKTAKSGFDRFLHETDWTRDAIDKTFCHQVGKMHEKLLFETLELDKSINYSTLEQLGNTGSAALPTAASLGIENGHVAPGERVALLGIGSGINTIMLGVEWGDS